MNYESFKQNAEALDDIICDLTPISLILDYDFEPAMRFRTSGMSMNEMDVFAEAFNSAADGAAVCQPAVIWMKFVNLRNAPDAALDVAFKAMLTEACLRAASVMCLRAAKKQR